MFKIFRIKVLPGSSINKIVEQGQDYIKIKLTAPAHEGKANKTLIKFLSEHFKVGKNKINIISGEKSSDKKVRICTP
jgi:hypothetical protein